MTFKVKKKCRYNPVRAFDGQFVNMVNPSMECIWKSKTNAHPFTIRSNGHFHRMRVGRTFFFSIDTTRNAYTLETHQITMQFYYLIELQTWTPSDAMDSHTKMKSIKIAPRWMLRCFSFIMKTEAHTCARVKINMNIIAAYRN